MLIYYRDGVDYVLAEVDDNIISFLDGIAYFTCGGEDYKIPMKDIVEISNL